MFQLIVGFIMLALSFVFGNFAAFFGLLPLYLIAGFIDGALKVNR